MKPPVALLLGALLAGRALAQNPRLDRVEAETVPAVARPSWDVADRRPLPAWFARARFGIRVHWGVYSVPAWGPPGSHAEWYQAYMRSDSHPTARFHAGTYGRSATYADFAPDFRAELFDADAWAALFAHAGARYVVVTAKHHDGYCLWPSAQAPHWNAVAVGPGRDLVGELASAVRREDMRFGVAYSLLEWSHPLYPQRLDRYVAEVVHPQLRDIVTRYRPDLLYADGDWEQTSDAWRSAAFLSWLWADSPAGAGAGADVVVNDRWGSDARGRHGGYATIAPELLPRRSALAGRPWEHNRAVGYSFGFNRAEEAAHYASTAELVRALCSTVAAGGNLLLSVGPTADGRIPPIVEERLIGLGDWLAANGRAIYGAEAGPYQDLAWGVCTQRPGRLYLCVFERPGGTVELPGLRNPVRRAYRLADGEERPLEHGRARDSVVIELGATGEPASGADVVVLEIEGEPDVERIPRQDAEGVVVLAASEARVLGESIRRDGGVVVGWSDPEDEIEWDFRVFEPGLFHVEVEYASAAGGGEFVTSVGAIELRWTVGHTHDWETFAADEIGALQIPRAGDFTLVLRPTRIEGDELMRLRTVWLTPVGR